MSRRYPVPGVPGVVVFRSGRLWEIDDDGTPRTDVVNQTIVHAGEGDGPWSLKRDAIADVQASYGFALDLERAGWPEDCADL